MSDWQKGSTSWPCRKFHISARTLSNHDASKESNADARKDAPSKVFAILEQETGNHSGKADNQCRRNNGTLVEGKHEFLLVRSVLSSDKEESHHGSHDTGTRHPKGEHDKSHISIGQGDGSNDRSNLRKKLGCDCKLSVRMRSESWHVHDRPAGLF